MSRVLIRQACADIAHRACGSRSAARAREGASGETEGPLNVEVQNVIHTRMQSQAMPMGSVWSTLVSSLHRLPVARELHLATRRKNKGLACISRHGQSSPGGRVEDTRAAAQQQLLPSCLHERDRHERLHAWCGGSCGWYRRGKGGRVTWGENGALPCTPSRGCIGAPSEGVCRKTSDEVLATVQRGKSLA